MPSDHYLGDGPNPASDLALGQGRQIDGLGAADTEVTLAHNVEGGQVGDTVTVPADRAAWLIANGKAIQPERYSDQYRQPLWTEPEGEAPGDDVPAEPPADT